jgi:hypothetical protein
MNYRPEVLFYWSIQGPTLTAGSYDDTMRYMIWNTTIRAPISKIMNSAEINLFLKDNGYLDDKGQLAIPDRAFGEIESLMMIKDNTAGANGENLEVEQIMELYK